MKQDEFIKEFEMYFEYTPKYKYTDINIDKLFNFINHLLSKQPSRVSEGEIEKEAERQVREFYGEFENFYDEFIFFTRGAKWALSLSPQSVQSGVSEEDIERMATELFPEQKGKHWVRTLTNAKREAYIKGFKTCLNNHCNKQKDLENEIEWLHKKSLESNDIITALEKKSLSPQSDAVEFAEWMRENFELRIITYFEGDKAWWYFPNNQSKGRKISTQELFTQYLKEKRR